MDLSAILSAITNVGFPIACCVACFYYIARSTQSHKEEIDTMSDAINNNTIVMTKLIERLNQRESL